jgi:cytochrome P450
MAGNDEGSCPEPAPVKLISKDFVRDPYPALAACRAESAAIPIENGGFRMWLVTGYDNVRRTLADPAMRRDMVRNRKEVVDKKLIRPDLKARKPRALRRSMLDHDGDDHKRLKSVVLKHFSPAKLTELRAKVELLADDLLGRLPVGVPVDLVQRYAIPVTSTIMSDLMGVPEGSRDDYPAWVNDMISSAVISDIESAARQLSRFCKELVELKRAEPREDMASDLVCAAREGKMDEQELEGTIGIMLVGGMEPYSAISSGILTLLNHPTQLEALLAEPRLLPGCVDEILRYESPFRIVPPRYAEQPYEVGGVTIPAHEFILLSIGAANRDPERFRDPDIFDIERDTRGHLAFSHGTHRCLGAELGKLELTIAISKLFDRFPNASLAIPQDQVKWRFGTFMRRLDSLPVILG